ncbi:hypothetical protein C5167_001393 [Papaver somniferum]|uniref:Uncharacterized protein n=1 Tax=Papaver somniferum TaxID=3469 RepID=A0A4Y7KZ95_PAPSO|nr:hypothetical protein C5167_001393 [Papaver somniferum]
MTEEQRSSNLFEHVMHEHVQEEVVRLLGCVSRVAMNTSEGYMELGPQHRALIHTTFDDMLEFDEQINNPEDDCNESHQEDVHEGQKQQQKKKNTIAWRSITSSSIYYNEQQKKEDK